jgi:hypothetical protein
VKFQKGQSGNPKGRTPGPNKFTKELKDMILGALSSAGGEKYLVKQAEENPTAFLTLVGKVLPMTLSGPDGDAVQVRHTVTVQVVGRS